MSSDTEYIKSIMTKQRESSMFECGGFLSSGSTLLNLACTGTIEGAWPIGAYSLIVGDSRAGKTWLAMCAFAEACQDKRFDDHQLIYDGPEDGALMDVEKFFGKKMYDRMEAPSYDDDGAPEASSTVEEFYFRLDDLLTAKKKIIYVIDSMDCLSSYAEESKLKELKTAFKKKKSAKGIMTDGKAKVNSSNLRNVVKLLGKSDSIVLILSQTRDSLTSMFDPKTHSGGKALRFYSAVEVWLAIKEHLKKTVRKKPRRYGICSKMKVEKSRITGRTLSVDVPILYASGLDDIGGCIDYLLEEEEWKRVPKSVNTKGFVKDFKGSRTDLIRLVEEGDREGELSELVGRVWADIDEKTKTKRKQKYS